MEEQEWLKLLEERTYSPEREWQVRANKRRARVLYLRQTMTMKEIGLDLGVGPVRIRQILVIANRILLRTPYKDTKQYNVDKFREALHGIPTGIVGRLVHAGYRHIDAIVFATDEQLLSIYQFGPKRLASIRKVLPYVKAEYDDE